MPNTLTGTEAAAAIYAQVRARAARLDAPPCLAAVSVGAQPDDRAYLRSIALSAAGCGVTVRPVPLPADCAPETLTDTLRTLSADDGVHGVLLPGRCRRRCARRKFSTRSMRAKTWTA